MSDRERLERVIPVSRRYWGPPTRALYWRLLASWLDYRVDRRRRAVGLLRRGREAWRRGRPLSGTARALTGAVLAPDVLADVVVLPALRAWTRRVGRARVLASSRDPQTLAWRDFESVHADGWVGPVLVRGIDVPEGLAHVLLRGTLWSAHFQPGLALSFFIDGRSFGRQQVGRGPSFTMTVPLTGVAPGTHQLRVEASAWVVPDRHFGNHDYRPLSYRLDALGVGTVRD
jgi:hypothetical protein